MMGLIRSMGSQPKAIDIQTNKKNVLILASTKNVYKPTTGPKDIQQILVIITRLIGNLLLSVYKQLVSKISSN